MISRRSLFGVAAGVLVAAAVAGSQLIGGDTAPVHAGEKMNFDQAAFDAAQAAGKPILIDIRADWCIVCARQAPIIQSLAAQPRFSELVVFEIDFDSQKDLVRDFDAFRQATLIAYKGSEEVGRSIYESRADAIEDLLELTL